ncbi:MAG: potassium channel family protein [Candidatus Brocadiia bacterium]
MGGEAECTGTLAAYPPESRLVPAIYFSSVTMTTLGYGDMSPNPERPLAQGLSAFQTFLGYVLLGALVTRFAIMFQGDTVPWAKNTAAS